MRVIAAGVMAAMTLPANPSKRLAIGLTRA
jgi:hypothetical protein